jgi:DNA-binding PucR family transcriptional regulator
VTGEVDSTSQRAGAARRLQRASGALATAATARMDERLPWFRQLPADERAWVSLVAQTGIQAFVEWFGREIPRPEVSVDVFDTAPRDLARAISLQQTVEMVRCTIELIEEHLPILAGPEAADEVHAAVLRYSREVAFAAAEVYARAAEARGAWDARLEALVLEGLLRADVDSALAARAAALGWPPADGALVLVGNPIFGSAGIESELDLIRRAAHHHGADILTGLHGDTLTAIVSRSGDDARTARLFTPHFGAGPVIVSAPAHGLSEIASRAAQARWALRAAPAWPGAPRPVQAEELLPERALAGDFDAREQLHREAFEPISADPTLVATLGTYLEQEGSLEGTARALFVHPNTVRYRLRRIEELTGRSPTDPRDALPLRLALIWARLAETNTHTRKL